MMAAIRGNIEAVQWLLDHGADRTLKSSESTTASYLAKDRGFNDVVELLDTYDPAPVAPSTEFTCVRVFNWISSQRAAAADAGNMELHAQYAELLDLPGLWERLQDYPKPLASL